MREGGAAPTAWRAGVAVHWRGGGEGLRQRVGLGEGFWEGGVLRHVRLRLVQGVAEARQHAVLGVELAVPRHQHRGQHWEEREKRCPVDCHSIHLSVCAPFKMSAFSGNRKTSEQNGAVVLSNRPRWIERASISSYSNERCIKLHFISERNLFEDLQSIYHHTDNKTRL